MIPFADIPLARRRGVLVCLAVGLAFTGWSRADEEKQKEAQKAEVTGDETELSASVAEGEKPEIKNLDLLPIGKTNLGVRMPVFEGAKQTMFFKADELTPMSEDQLDMTGVEITILKKDDPAAGAAVAVAEGDAEEEAVDTRIVMLSSSYLVSAALLVSDETTVVYGSNFTLTGASLDFDTGKKAGVMRGPVKMIIRDFDKLNGDKEADGVLENKEAAQPEAETEPATEPNNESISNDKPRT